MNIGIIGGGFAVIFAVYELSKEWR